MPVPMPTDSAAAPSAAQLQALDAAFQQLCNFGGRLLGTDGERQAVAWVGSELRALDAAAELIPLSVQVWQADVARLTRLDNEQDLDCQPMLHTVSTPEPGLVGEVVDMGGGRPEDYARHGHELRGHIAMFEHEYPFSPTHLHRREKIRLAIRHGARACLLANSTGFGSVLSGSSATLDGHDPIPCCYISRAAAAALRTPDAPDGKRPTVRLRLSGHVETATTATASALVGSRGKPEIVLSAHIDGHPLGESALDNATGVAVALAAARYLAPALRASDYALRVLIFSAEEWGLWGSRQYLASLPGAARSRMKLNLNLDTVGGAPNLTALTSGFTELNALVDEAAAAAGTSVATFVPLMANSDHYNFACHGIPALRLIAGFDRPESRVQHILSGHDTRDKVQLAELAHALHVTVALVQAALRRTPAQLDALARRASSAANAGQAAEQ